MGRILSKKQQALIVSSGGVGTTLLIEFIGSRLRTNHPTDKDMLKHLTVPPICLNPETRILYVHGDPVAATASLFRRGYHHSQAKKLQRFISGPKRRIPFSMSLDEYAAAGEDRLFMHDHFMNWHSRHVLNDTLFVRFETMWDHLEEIFRFLGLPEKAISSFPPQGKRSSSSRELNANTNEALETMLAPLKQALGELPDIHRVHAEPVPMWRHALLLTHQARCAISGQSQHLFRCLRLGGKTLRRALRNALCKPFGYKPKNKQRKNEDVL